MKIQKSTRHSKITGDFAEHLILYWLSKYGFESARVDHTGIDLIANNPITHEVMGISVKGRCRALGTESYSLDIRNDELEKIDNACLAFGCKPYFALMIDAADGISIFILSKEKFLKLASHTKNKLSWGMRSKHLSVYDKDKDIIKINFKYSACNWWK